jgi:hypothetical protein
VNLNRRALGEAALARSMELRFNEGVGFERPICIYDLCERLGIIVRFNDINMEGMYDRIPKPRIHLSAIRPLGRRAFNCAHELGHHLFEQGSTVDEMRRDSSRRVYTDPREFIADVFAGHLLMPMLGVGYAFRARGWDPEKATRGQFYRVACHFGVGYATLVNHLIHGVQEISPSRLGELNKPLSQIRREILGYRHDAPLIVADEHWASHHIDLEVGSTLILPDAACVEGDVVSEEQDLFGKCLFRGHRKGVGKVRFGDGVTIELRVSPYQFVGLAKYRHKRDEEEE